MPGTAEDHRGARFFSRRPFLTLGLATLTVLVIFVGTMAAWVYSGVSGAVSRAYTPQYHTDPTALNSHTPLTILIVGHNEAGTATVVNVAAVNPITGKTTIASLPPQAQLPSGGTLAHSYAAFGLQGVIDETRSLLAVPINMAVQVSMAGLGAFAQAIGGVSVENPSAFKAGGYLFNAGSLSLGTQAEVSAYLSLVNAQDGQALLLRQASVAMAILTDMKSTKVLWRYRQLLSAYANNATSTMKLSSFVGLARHYAHVLGSVNKINFHTSMSGTVTALSAQELAADAQLFRASLH